MNALNKIVCIKFSFRLFYLAGLGILLFSVGPASGQADSFDPKWILTGETFVKIAVLEDGMYRVTGSELASAGAPINDIAPSTLRLLENGKDVPIWIEGGGTTSFQPEDAMIFAGRRNRGEDELWAYNDASLQSSTYFSLYSDTTWYWLTWGGNEGLRYSDTDPEQAIENPIQVNSFRDTLHIEEDIFYYFGDSDDAGQPEYTRGEGYYGWSLSHQSTESIEKGFILDLENLTNNSDSLVVTAQLSSGSAPLHRVTLHLEADGEIVDCSSCSDELSWSGYTFRMLRIALPQNVIASQENIRAVITSHNEFNSTPNRVLIDWIEVHFTSVLRYSADPLSFSFPIAGNRSFSVINEPSVALVAYNELDRTRYLLSQATGSLYSFNEHSTGANQYWIVEEDDYIAPARLQLRQAFDLTIPPNNIDYILITKPFFAPSANEMAEYRRSTNGYEVLIVDQADIFDQFDYGRPTPLAIQRFVHVTQEWTYKPQFVTFWGDALRPEDNRARRPLLPWEVISFGYSPSDSWFGMHKNGLNDWIERPAIGRIPIRNNERGSFFVQKMANYESSAVAAWQKKLLLLVGGKNNFEQSRLQAHALSWENHATGIPTGMNSVHFFKTSEAPLDPSFQDSLSFAFKDGTSWISYFGHSAADTWEIVTDAPEDYDNADRLPVVVSIGCNTGNFAGGRFELTDRLVYGERLVLASMNGAIAHWGSSSPSYIEQPAALTNFVHEVVFQDTIRTLGSAFQEGKRRFVEARSQSGSVYNVLLQYGLIGDPATRIQIAEKPEFQTSAEAIEITPVTPVPADGELIINADVRNWGMLPVDSVNVQLQHQGPGGTEVVFSQKMVLDQLEESVTFASPIQDTNIGENQISVTIDPENRFSEVDEFNNTAEKKHTVFSAGLALISPLNFAVVSSATPRLRASLATNDSQNRTVLFELDTSPLFNSPQLRSIQNTTIGAVADWQISSPLTDNQSYYWRARIESDELPGAWQVGHFRVETNSTGNSWSQQGNQFSDNETDPYLQWDSDQLAWEFTEFNVDIRATAERGNGFEKGQFIVNGTRFLGVTLGFGVIVIDGATGELETFEAFPTYQISEELQDRFGTDSTRAVDGLESLIENLDDGDYVFVRTRHLGNLSGPIIQPEVKDMFRTLGSQAIDTLSYNHLWLLTTRAGSPDETVEWVEPPGTGFRNEIAQDTTLFFMQSEGQMFSPIIGPAASWQSFNAVAQIPNVDSEIRLDIMGIGGDNILFEDIQVPGSMDISSINTSEYPFIRLRATLVDSSQLTTPQLKAWSVFSEPTTELAINPSETTFSADTLNVAETLRINTSILNLSDTPAPLATLSYTLTDASNQEKNLAVDTLKNISANAQLSSNLSVETVDLFGMNRIRIDLTQQGVTEPFTLNNVLIREFFVHTDNERPRLEILIDNEMLPSDFEPVSNLQDPMLPFVSSQPSIEIIISDEGAFQLLNDTSLVQLELDKKAVHFTDPNIQFQHGTIDKNEARIFYTPDLSGRDTTHTLFLRVFDAAGNEADESPYQVHFRVQSAFEIESLYPYPNPMHTATTFAFRLRGDDALLADEFRIRIYTLSGRLIKEFDLIEEPFLLETPGLRIGWNKLVWDGRDADGDLVATGVYLYKVFLKSDNKSLRVNNSSNVEKLVVLR